METIVPCRTLISERFPIASFSVRMPQRRLYEVAVATDPRLFHTDYANHRTPRNFYSSRAQGLLVAERDDEAFMLPPEQLRRFAGARRLYYALGTYGGRNGEDPHFSIGPDTLDRVPSIGLSTDFTGRALDRMRLGGSVRNEPTYGGSPAGLRWGGDAVLESHRAMRWSGSATGAFDYDDGYGEMPGATTPDRLEEDDYADDHVVGTEESADAPGDLIAPSSFTAPRAASATDIDEPEDEDGFEYHARHETQLAAPKFAYGRVEETAQAFEDGADYHRRGGQANGEPGRYGDPVVTAPAYRPPPMRAAPLDLDPEPEDEAQDDGSGRHPEYREEDELEMLPVGPAARPLGTEPLTIQKKVEILRVVARPESGGAGYAAVNPDTEYNTPTHPAYQRYHIGLSWGFIQFTQRSGSLGKVLRKAKEREEQRASEGTLPDEHRFERVFGPQWESLLETTDPERTQDADARVAPVGGVVLWEEPWLSRFRAAGQIEYLQAAQNEIAVLNYFDRMLPLARWLGLRTARGLAMLVDRAVHMGVGGGRSWIMRAVGPIRSEADREAALTALGHAPDDLRAFQQSMQGLTVDGRWGPMTHAALISALRALGDAAPLVVPTPEQVLHEMLDFARGSQRLQRRLRALLENRSDFDDAVTFELG
jgi:hypothetical protein